MAKAVRRNQTGDAKRVRTLARRHGLSAVTVREPGNFDELADGFEAAMRELAALGGIDDVLHKMPFDEEAPLASGQRAETAPLKA